MAGMPPMPQATAGQDKLGQMMGMMRQVSPPVNPGTPNDRIDVDEKRMEQYQRIRLLLKHLADDNLETDQVRLSIIAAFRVAVTQMLLNAEPDFVMSELQKHLAGAGPGAAPMAGAPGPLGQTVPAAGNPMMGAPGGQPQMPNPNGMPPSSGPQA